MEQVRALFWMRYLFFEKKPFRKINNTMQLPNSVNEKDCLVVIEFEISSVKWKVVRGIKPNIFEISRNNTSRSISVCCRSAEVV